MEYIAEHTDFDILILTTDLLINSQIFLPKREAVKDLLAVRVLSSTVQRKPISSPFLSYTVEFPKRTTLATYSLLLHAGERTSYIHTLLTPYAYAGVRKD